MFNFEITIIIILLASFTLYVYQSLSVYVIICIRIYKLRIQQYYIILTISLLSPLAPLDNRNLITSECPKHAALDSGVSRHYNKT